MKTFSFLCLIATCAFLLCCNCYGKINRRSNLYPVVERAMNIQVDDSVKILLGDSICRILFEADKVKMFSLTVKPPVDSLKTDRGNNDSIVNPNFHGCFIEHDYGELSESAACPILLILSDRDNYLPDGVQLKSPFTPSVALSFVKEDACVDIVFSFTGGQMFIFMSNEEKLYYKYTYERLVMKFFQSYLQDERITKYLNL